MERFRPRDSYYCANAISEGLEKNNIKDIEHGLSLAYDLFVSHVLGDRREDLIELGRDLNAVYFPYRSRANEPGTIMTSYQGQMRALINLCDYITQILVPERAWQVVHKSKYAKPILQALLKERTMLATELCESVGLIHKTQLARIVKPLVNEGLIRQERFGKNVWYSLTANGRLMAAKHFGAEGISALESVLPPIIARLGSGWHSLSNLVNSLRISMPNSTLRSLVRSLLSALYEAGIAEELGGNWRISPSLLKESRWPIEISASPELVTAATIIEKEYDQLQHSGVADRGHIGEARSILDKTESEIAISNTQEHAFKVRLALERGKCAALEGSWRTAVNLMKEAETTAELHGIDAQLLERESDRVWAYIQAASVEPLVLRAKSSTDMMDYYRATDTLLEIYQIYKHARRSFSNADLLDKILLITIGLSTVAHKFDQEFEQKLDQALERQSQAVSIEEQFSPFSELWEYGQWRYDLADHYIVRG